MKKSVSIRLGISWKKLGLFCVAGLSALSANPVHAASETWILPGSGNWTTNTGTLNWNDGVTNPTFWADGNDAVFGTFTSLPVITLTTNIVANSLNYSSATNTQTMQIGAVGGTTTLTVPTITTGTASIDMYSILTGSGGLTYNGTVASGRLNLKRANTYTGATTINNSTLYVGDVSNSLPTGTDLTINGASSQFVITNASSQQVASVSGNGRVQGRTGVNTLVINTGSGASTTYSGVFSEIAGTPTTRLNIEVKGAGTQTFSAVNTQTGTLLVSGGTLVLANAAAAGNNSGLTVSGGTLRSSVANANLGAGFFSMSAGALDARGIGTAGTFTLAANQNFSTTGGTLNFDLGTSFDRVLGSGTGTFTLQDTTIALNQIAGFNVANTYNIFGGFASSPALSNVSFTYNGAAFAGYMAILDNTTGNLTFAAVPEPSTYALLGLGLAGLFFLRRGKSSRA